MASIELNPTLYHSQLSVVSGVCRDLSSFQKSLQSLIPSLLIQQRLLHPSLDYFLPPSPASFGVIF
jgi:hypothetical protein